jgi:mycothiol maleylpyruvate isomerase-like protein
MAAEPLAHLSQVLDLAQSLIERARPEQAGLPTPCRSWDVQALVAHLVNDTGQFTAAATRGRPDWDTPAPEIGGDWANAFRTARPSCGQPGNAPAT